MTRRTPPPTADAVTASLKAKIADDLTRRQRQQHQTRRARDDFARRRTAAKRRLNAERAARSPVRHTPDCPRPRIAETTAISPTGATATTRMCLSCGAEEPA